MTEPSHQVEKTAVIAQWPDTHARLRSASIKRTLSKDPMWLKTAALREMHRTMVTLDLFGVLGKCASFPKP